MGEVTSTSENWYQSILRIHKKYEMAVGVTYERRTKQQTADPIKLSCLIYKLQFLDSGTYST